MIDLEQFVGKEVVVTCEDGTTREGVIEKENHPGHRHPYSLIYGNSRGATYTRDGYYWSDKKKFYLDIKSIKLKKEKPMIDLEQFVGKEVVVTRENGTTEEGVIERNDDSAFPYSFQTKRNFFTYTRDGYWWRASQKNHHNIKSIKLKEKPMIDLEQFVGKEVVVTREDGTTEEGLIKRNEIRMPPYASVMSGQLDCPYLFQSKRNLFTYTRDGYWSNSKQQSPHNIKSITLKSDNLDNFLDWAEKATLEELDSFLTDQKKNNKVAAFLKKNLLTIFFPSIMCYGFFIPNHSIIHYYAGVFSMLSLATAVELVNVKKDE